MGVGRHVGLNRKILAFTLSEIGITAGFAAEWWKEQMNLWIEELTL